MLYVLKKEQVEHVRLRALAQAIVQKEKGPEAFDSYMKVAFPWIETQKGRDKSDHVRLLLEEVKRGAISIVSPLWQQQTRVRSRLKTKVVERVKSKEELDKLYTKL